MKSKLYKTHRKASYYRLRRLGYFSMSLMVATIIVVVPLTLAQAGTASSPTLSSTMVESSTSSHSSSNVQDSSSEDHSETEVALGGTEVFVKLLMIQNP